MSPLETQKNVLPFLRECSLLAPTFLSLDNHEWMLDSTDLITLASTCVVVLDNTYQSITFDEKEIILGGLTSGYVTDYRRFKEKAHSSDRYPRQESISRIGGAVHSAMSARRAESVAHTGYTSPHSGQRKKVNSMSPS